MTFTSCATGRARRCPAVDADVRGRHGAGERRHPPAHQQEHRRGLLQRRLGRVGGDPGDPRRRTSSKPITFHTLGPLFQGEVGQHRGVPAGRAEARGAGAADGGPAALLRVPGPAGAQRRQAPRTAGRPSRRRSVPRGADNTPAICSPQVSPACRLASPCGATSSGEGAHARTPIPAQCRPSFPTFNPHQRRASMLTTVLLVACFVGLLTASPWVFLSLRRRAAAAPSPRGPARRSRWWGEGCSCSSTH